MRDQPLDGKTIILRIELDTKLTFFGTAATAIENAGGDIIAIDVIQTSREAHSP